MRSVAKIPNSTRLNHLDEALCTEAVGVQTPARPNRIRLKRLVYSVVPGEQSSGVVQEVTIIAKRNQQLFDGDLQKTAEPLVVTLDGCVYATPSASLR